MIYTRKSACYDPKNEDEMSAQPIIWGLLCGSLYFLVMWRIRSRRLSEQRETARGLYALSEEIVASTTPAGLAAQLEARQIGRAHV